MTIRRRSLIVDVSHPAPSNAAKPPKPAITLSAWAAFTAPPPFAIAVIRIELHLLVLLLLTFVFSCTSVNAMRMPPFTLEGLCSAMQLMQFRVQLCGDAPLQ